MNLTEIQRDLLRAVGNGKYFYRVHRDEVVALLAMMNEGLVIVRQYPDATTGADKTAPIAWATLTTKGKQHV